MGAAFSSEEESRLRELEPVMRQVMNRQIVNLKALEAGEPGAREEFSELGHLMWLLCQEETGLEKRQAARQRGVPEAELPAMPARTLLPPSLQGAAPRRQQAAAAAEAAGRSHAPSSSSVGSPPDESEASTSTPKRNGEERAPLLEGGRSVRAGIRHRRLHRGLGVQQHAGAGSEEGGQEERPA